MINIAIDGPAGAGKSSAARLVAEKLGFVYVDTGALYRAVGVAVMRKGADTTDKKAVLSVLPDIDITLKFLNGLQHVFLNGEDVSEEIRFPNASMAASNVSAMPQVREFLSELQHKLARENNCIMDGRDIGTVILPNAQVKIFLTASAQVRAKRRYDELKQKGTPIDFDMLLDEIKLRDYNDSHRATAPLVPAFDALIIDSSDMDLDEVVEKIINICKEKI